MMIEAPGTRPHRPNLMGTRHVVSAGHYLGAEAGFLVLEAGGNAVDAGVAAGITLNVVEPHMCCFGGGRADNRPSRGNRRDHYRRWSRNVASGGVVRLLPAPPPGGPGS